MKVLMLSTDGNIFIEGSEVRQRMIDYGGLVDELHIIIFTSLKDGEQSKKIGANVFLYPTRTLFGLFCFYLIDVYKLGSQIIKKENGWLVTTQDPFETGLAGWLLKVRLKLPIQIQVHTDFLSSYFSGESVRNRVRMVLGKSLLKKADGIRVVSERIKNSLIENCKLKIENSAIAVLPIVYDMDRFSKVEVKTDLHKKYPNHDFIILMASRLTKEKNIGLAVRALKEVVKKHPKVLLLIVGSGPEFEGLRLQVVSCKLQDFVVFEPWTNDMPSYYKTADVFVLTSNYEGGARSPAEAIASGLPVVMTDVAPAGETIIDGKNGFIVPVGNHRQLADRLIELISDENKRIMFKKQSLDMVVGFITKEVYLKLYYQTFTNALTKNKKP